MMSNIILRFLGTFSVSFVIVCGVLILVRVHSASVTPSGSFSPRNTATSTDTIGPPNPTATPTSTPTPTPTPTIVDISPEIVTDSHPPELTWEEMINLSLGGPDVDCDGIKAKNDNCPFYYNPGQKDRNRNGIGDVCEKPGHRKFYSRCDSDNDGVLDYKDNCPLVCNPDQKDRNHNGIGDLCDPKLLKDWVRINPCTKSNKNDKSKSKWR